MKCAIYKITNTINGKIYIGSAINFKKRKAKHLSELRGGYHYNKFLQRSYNKYGEESFTFEIIEEVEDKNNLIERENYHLNNSKCTDRKIGYNKCKIAWSAIGVKRSNEWKRLMSMVHKGKVVSAESRKKMSESHKLMSDETRQRISESKKGTKKSQEWKSKVSERMKGNKWNVGKKLSEITKEKLRKINQGKILPRYKCPHCGIEGSFGIHRYHFNKCKKLINCAAA